MKSRAQIDDDVSAEAFESRYRAQEDPWNYRSSSYERAKYHSTLAALSRDRYRCAFEPGCSIGELTAMLARRCDRLFAVDVSPTAVERARFRCRVFNNVRIECMDVHSGLQSGPFDLIVLSEIGYYFDVPTLTDLASRLADSLTAGGELIAVHWRGHSTDHILHADEVHRVLLEQLTLQAAPEQRHPGFRINSWLKHD